MYFVVVKPFTKSNNCQECGNIKVRDNYNSIIDARWTSAPGISQHASEIEPFIARNTTAYVGVASASFKTLF